MARQSPPPCWHFLRRPMRAAASSNNPTTETTSNEPPPPLLPETVTPDEACAVTVTVTFAGADVAPCVSLTVYAKLSVSENPIVGVYTIVPLAFTTAVPWLGPLVTRTLDGAIAPSGSLSFPTTLIVTA